MKARIQSNQRQALFGDSSPRGPKRAQGKYAKMENELRRGNQDFIDDQIQRQQVNTHPSRLVYVYSEFSLICRNLFSKNMAD